MIINIKWLKNYPFSLKSLKLSVKTYSIHVKFLLLLLMNFIESYIIKSEQIQ